MFTTTIMAHVRATSFVGWWLAAVHTYVSIFPAPATALAHLCFITCDFLAQIITASTVACVACVQIPKTRLQFGSFTVGSILDESFIISSRGDLREHKHP